MVKRVHSLLLSHSLFYWLNTDTIWKWHGLKTGSTRAWYGLNLGSMRAQCDIGVGFLWARHELDSDSTWDVCGLGIGLMQAWCWLDAVLTPAWCWLDRDLCMICHKYIYPNADGQQCIFEILVKTQDNARILVLSGNITHNDTQKFSTRSSLSTPLDAVQAKVRVLPHIGFLSQ